MKYVITAVLLLLIVLMLSLSVKVKQKAQIKEEGGEVTLMENRNTKTIYLAGGCFWGMQKLFDSLSGVVSTTVGYANGNKDITPDYKLVTNGNTGYKETVKVDYDPKIIPLENILKAYFYVIDPSLENQQGNDKGAQYQTGIYYTDKADLPIIGAIATQVMQTQPVFKVQIEPLMVFYPAEEYHQKYLEKNPGGYCHISSGQISTCAAKFSGQEVLNPKYTKPSDSDLKKKLTKEQYQVTQNAVTEQPFNNEYWDFDKKGVYVDIATGQPLFTSEQKYKSTSGWPSFSAPLDSAVKFKEDESHGMERTEVLSQSGNSHLGHVFEDDSASPTGTRYCMNSASMKFIPYDDLDKDGYGYIKKEFKK